MLIAAERREAQVAGLGETKDVSMHRIASISGEVRAVVGEELVISSILLSFKKSAVERQFTESVELKFVMGDEEAPKGQVSALFSINLCSNIALFSVGLADSFSST